MPLRDNPTARQVRLGAELRKLRERAGKTARETAGLLSTDQAKMSHIESGRIGVSEERIRRLAVFYACDDGPLVDALCAIARESRGQGWWDEYRGVLGPDFLDIAELEHHAAYLRSVQVVNVPGILQTEDYIRAIHGSYRPVLPVDVVDRRVEFRLRRQSLLEQAEPPSLRAIVHEAALRMRFGGREVAKGQLEHLLETSARPSVTVRVIPFSCEDYIEATNAPMYAGGVVPQLDTVHLDSPAGSYVVGAEAELNRYRQLLDVAEGASLSEAESRKLIQRIVREI
ncbi:helix-turn-helix domain-containing protein [Streptomyces adelaidensis]|uniref:helix-turn-helix domain-containing protein n=1 Tax=Streptomyces adelaidensis TaxID=2796465 RepID=UPI001904AC68|nr:helix-turn-helix transcriptional regulator [Streptomyces adelaidensis]